ncbi:MAG: M28 family peptidase [Synechococcales cyanobacterium]
MPEEEMLDDENLLRHHLERIAQPRDPDWSPWGHAQVWQYVITQMQRWGEVESFPFTYGGQTYHNQILKLPGGSGDPVIVGAHVDAVPESPGADDNASGVAVLLTLAGALTRDPARHPIWLVAFDLEERGLVGSYHYAQWLRQQRQRVRLMLSLEMVGYRGGEQRYPPGLARFYPAQGDFLALIGNLSSLGAMGQMQRHVKNAGIPCERLPVPGRGSLIPDTRRSDHASFWDAGYRAVLVTDTANLRNPHYHKLSDTLETLDMDFLTGVYRGLAAAIRALR